MDKPLPTIELIITPDNETVVNMSEKRVKVRVYIMSLPYNNFMSVLKIVDASNTHINFDKKVDYPYGSYEVKYENDNNQFSYMLPANEKSLTLFKHLISFTKPNNYLYQELSELIKTLK